MKKIFVISVGRSDYDRYYPIIRELNNSSKVKLFLFLAKQHFNKTLGKTASYIDKKFYLLKNQYHQKNYRDSKVEIINNFSDDLKFLNKKIKKFKPNLLIVLGDRIEMLVGPIAAIPNNIPVIHLYGGAVTEGSTDELVRHAITKMSHCHFVLLNQYKKRLIQLGEEKWRIKKIGMHELKYLKSLKKISKNELKKIFHYDFTKPYLLVTFHPVTLELNYLGHQLKSLAKAIKRSKLNAVITYPNADLKHLDIIQFLKKNFNDNKKIIYWLPTYIPNKNENDEDQNLKQWIHKLSFLNEFYNIILRPHPRTVSRNKRIVSELKSLKYCVDDDFDQKIGQLLIHSDLVIADYGGMVFDSIFLNKKILLLNLKKSSEFVQELINNDSLDLKVRSDVLNLEETSSRKEIHESFKEALSGKNNQDNLQNLKLVYFGKTRTMDHEEIINYLNSLLRY